MNIKSIIFIVFIYIISLFSINSYGFTNEPTGFRGIDWGADISKFTDMSLCASGEDGIIKVYTKNNENFKFVDADLTQIMYSFNKGRFCGVAITFKEYSNFTKIKDTLFQTYGEGLKKVDESKENYLWFGDNVIIDLKYYENNNVGELKYTNLNFTLY